MSGLDTLRQRYPWPVERPVVPAECAQLHGWFAGENQTALAKMLSPDTRVVLELGSWFGKSSYFLAENAPNATILCIDHWEGSREHHARPEWKAKLPWLYSGFLHNLWPFRDRVIPMRTLTLDGMREIAELQIEPEVVYVDASHEEEDVYNDTVTALTLFPKARILGDDWPWDSVRKAVVRAAYRMHLRVYGVACWEIPLEGRKIP